MAKKKKTIKVDGPENEEFASNEEEVEQPEEQEIEASEESSEEPVAEESGGDELAELKEQHVRLMAEFDNFRKRTAKEKADLLKYAEEDLMRALLPVLDDFERTIAAMETTDNLASVKEGIKLVSDNMSRIMQKQGLKSLDSLGKEFSLDYHEALQAVPVEEEEKKGKVIDVIEPGYMFKDKVIRYARVVIGE